VRIIVPLAPAGTSDIIARLMGQWLSERLGQQFVIENRTGAGTTLGTEAVVRAPADGYTLLAIDVSAAFNATLYDRLNFNIAARYSATVFLQLIDGKESVKDATARFNAQG
jgi:tripartite-type tricarboxylate transporter receptor subunit TctC